MEDIKMEQYMPSTSKIPFHSGKEYHVFLSFRGELRETLVHHLYEALTAAGLDVFVDSHKLEKGEIIESSLERALKGSAIRIPIFSQGYAQSAWCLREAATMVNTKGLIIPLFYDVLPTDVRFPLKESSPYKAAFLNHYAQSYHKGADIDGWKDALHQICSRSGWSMDLSGGSEAQLIKTVVNDVIKTFDRVHLQVAKHPVGLESLTHDLIHKFKLNSEGGVNKAGLWGIGGIGKTTLAKALYNQVSAKFDAASFVFNVRATAAEFMGLTKLQKKILKDLANHDEEVDSVEKGISLFRHRLRQKRVLLILDDVDGVEQLNALDGDWLAPGSGVIITSRDRHILRHAGVLSECIHEMSGLLINEGLQLFCWHAFLREHPTPTHKDLSERIVEACQGHPLSLEVIGSLLYDKQNDPDCWTEAFHNITLHPDIHERLKISYNALTEEEKEIFLDIACFFIGEHKMLPIVFWKSLYKTVHTAVHNLSLKLLIKIDDKGVFDMHDHLRDMGRSIAAERERECTRLWNADHLSRGVSNNNNFSRLRLNGGNSQRFETLYGSGLRLLHLENVPIAGITRAMLPPSLIWLQLQDCEKPSHFSLMRNMWRFAIQRPFHFRLMDLRILQTDGNISNLQYSLSYILGNLSQLQHLQLRNCRKLNKLPRTIGNLSKLQSLDLSYCIKLKKLSRTIGNLSQLQHLDLGVCTNLNNLPDTIGNLSHLQHLDLGGCTNLNNLPDTIGNLSQLQHLYLGGCTNLNNLPDTIGNLSQLQHLYLGGCTNLNNLPDTIGNLSQLQHLYLGGCTNLNNLPDTIGNLSQLQHLCLGGCTNLNNLPDTIGNLSQLQHLFLGWCTNLNNLPDTIGNLSQLQHLFLGWCTNLNNFPDTIGNLSQLQHLYLGRFTNLNNLPDTIGNLSQLQHLELGECTNLNNLPDTIGNLSQLQHLDLRGCTNLNNLPDTIGNLSQLQRLDLGGCTNLNNLPDTIGNLSQLQDLDLGRCTNLNNLPDTIGNLSQL
ncbi:disease resistance protein RPV1 [Cryptomeria japonica]|uniref:disease resistance protein RPV1 n=1 Tax=Cryptomeria japonica TaxID=3369 RepID=UPI0027DA6473|nr:disease resistance protein RPV1 [Cryptomeria japonica]XP_059069329.1 disease resistance protein RPV1 [Cryptomeria japonica]XP_059069330.1 disease resistance protein RPV1 [Cryptomeria japonica]XP_059069331.1 disease resistance protein RPV1 [Cryptomeria japonica]XP_059069332.1 disease resistance protein RPV1 [Cryptomeria japonica]XP_059069333.1 disease resistance protein RPV1 [Cryptomeria japonica]XP_059069334.1 disease resistance protein RPV1 [Cryptomeria japonica]XP_059069335.1 disease re